jgi:hypothetical protein
MMTDDDAASSGLFKKIINDNTTKNGRITIKIDSNKFTKT